MAIWPEAVSGSMLAMKKGLTDLGPLVGQRADGLLHERRATDAGAEDDADVLGVVRRR